LLARTWMPSSTNPTARRSPSSASFGEHECVLHGALLVPCKHAHHALNDSITLSHSLLAHTPRSAMRGAYNRARRGHAHRHQAQSSRGSWNVPSLLRGGDGRKGQHPSTSHPPRSLSVPHRATRARTYTTLCCASDTWLLITCLMVAFLCASAWLSCVCVAMCWHFCATFNSLSTLTAWPAACTP
jgi:hypothetical protein